MFLFKSPVCRLVCDVWRSWSSLSWRDWGWKVHSVSPPLPPSVLLPSLTSKALKLSAMSWNTTTVYDKSLDHKVATMTGVLLWVCHVKKKKKKKRKEKKKRNLMVVMCSSSLLVNDISAEEMNHVCSGDPCQVLDLTFGNTVCYCVCPNSHRWYDLTG